MNPRLAFRIQAQAGLLELDVYDQVGEESASSNGVTAAGVLKSLREAGNVSVIRLRINSLGGNAFDGVAIHNLLRGAADKGTRVEVDIDGIAASAASIIAAAGDEIRIAANGILMIHCAAMFAIGNADDLEHQAKILRQVDLAMAETYTRCAERRQRSGTDFAAKMQAETWMTASEAVEFGLADIITGKTAQTAITPQLAGMYKRVPAGIVHAIQPQQSSPMNIEIFLKTLGVDTAEKAIEAIRMQQNLVSEIEACTGKQGSSAVAVILAWQLASNRVPELEANVATLEKTLVERDDADRTQRVAALVEQGKLRGKIPVALENWAAAQSEDALASFLAAAPVVVANAGRKPTQEPILDDAALTDEDQKVAAAFGITPQVFAEVKLSTTHTVVDDDGESK